MLINMVDPSGAISLQDAPFTYVGNRGVLHRNGQIRGPSDGKMPWIYCAVSALRDPSGFMAENHQTDLFFLDEATALAAGHRPCHLCLGARQGELLEAWRDREISATNPIAIVDDILSSERLGEDGTKRTELLPAESLPTGTFIRFDGAPFLVAKEAVPEKVDPRSVVYPWSPWAMANQSLDRTGWSKSSLPPRSSRSWQQRSSRSPSSIS